MTAKRRNVPAGYLSQRALEGLKQYQYKSGGLTWLDHLHTPMWNATVNMLPMWLAPNLITLLGTVAVVVAWIMSCVDRPDYAVEPALPTWEYLFFAFSVVFYVNMDCMDGKQARRTGSSSPLGQLFDHGCDALSLHLLLDTVRTSLCLPPGWSTVTMEMAIMVPWMMAHWEEYHTGIMVYGNGWFGILEANYAMVVIHILNAVYGPGLWLQHIALPDYIIQALPAALQPAAMQLSVRSVMLISVAVMAVISMSEQLFRVLRFNTNSLHEHEVGNKQLGHGAAFLHLAYVALFVGLGWAFMTAAPESLNGTCGAPFITQLPFLTTQQQEAAMSFLGQYPVAATGLQGLYRMSCVGHLRVIGLIWGITYALFATQLILAHMSKEPFAPAGWALAALAIGAINLQLAIVPYVLLNAVLLALCVLGYAHYVFASINQICAFLGISCLTIKKRAKQQ